MNQGSNDTTFKQSYYYHNYNQSEFINDAYYDLIFGKDDDSWKEAYWLAGRYVHLWEKSCDFGLQAVYTEDGTKGMGGNSCVTLKGYEGDKMYGIRPIVTIDLASSNCTMTSSVNETGKMTIKLEFK